MNEVIQLARAAHPVPAPACHRGALMRTDAVHVVLTSIDDTLIAVRTASALARAIGAPLNVIHFRAVPYPLSVERPSGVSPVETEEFMSRVRAEGLDVRVRVYLCRSGVQVIPAAFKPGSIVVIGGRHGWWPTEAERLRQRLEAAGQFVLFVDAEAQKEAARA